jgi:hypothetical protein
MRGADDRVDRKVRMRAVSRGPLIVTSNASDDAMHASGCQPTVPVASGGQL